MADNVVPIRPQRTSEQLEALARRPSAYNREVLLELAERCRAIEAVQEQPDQLDLGEGA
jgi:hypothetical protein